MVEVLVVVAIMAILATLAATATGGFLSGSKGSAYNSEKETLQVGIDGWKNTIGKQTTRIYPILDGGENEACLGTIDANGDPTTPGCNPYVDIGAMADEEFLRNAAAVKSADTSRNTTALNEPTGSYAWYVDSDGLVVSIPDFIEKVYP